MGREFRMATNVLRTTQLCNVELLLRALNSTVIPDKRHFAQVLRFITTSGGKFLLPEITSQFRSWSKILCRSFLNRENFDYISAY